jgi:hypothetical protein
MKIRGRLAIWSGETETGMSYCECTIDDGVPRNLADLFEKFDNQYVVITIEKVEEK